jgi:hypothetical protein
LSEEEITQVVEIYKQFIKAKGEALQREIKEDPEVEKAYKQLQFTEKVINGEAFIIEDEETAQAHKTAKQVAAKSMLSAANAEKQYNNAQRKQFLSRKGK